MNIWHVDVVATPNSICGVVSVVWLLARQQVELGLRVVLATTEPIDAAAQALADAAGVTLVHVYGPRHEWLSGGEALMHSLRAHPPDIVHMHSVFAPRFIGVGRRLRALRIPYVVTPHGGLTPRLLRRRRLAKTAFALLFERSRLAHAAALTCVAPGEEAEIRAFVPGYGGPVVTIWNPIDIDQLAGSIWAPAPGRPQLAFIGRLDIEHKGVDRLVELARHLPEADIHAYGGAYPPAAAWLERLMREAPANFHLHDPVFGDAKLEVLGRASLYVQLSRWEGFPVTIAEAMVVGVPPVISEDLHMGQVLRERDLGLVVPADPRQAAAQVRALLDQPLRRAALSARCRAFARERFDPRRVALAHLETYARLLNGRSYDQVAWFNLSLGARW